jgi:hypothetical protein
MTNSDRITHLRTWTESPRNTPFVVSGHQGVFRYRYHYQPVDGQARVVLYGGKPPAHRIDVDVLDLAEVSEADMAMIKHASKRGKVLLDTTKTVTLLAWDVTRPKAKIVMASGAVLTVIKDRLRLPQGEETPDGSCNETLLEGRRPVGDSPLGHPDL